MQPSPTKPEADPVLPAATICPFRGPELPTRFRHASVLRPAQWPKAGLHLWTGSPGAAARCRRSPPEWVLKSEGASAPARVSSGGGPPQTAGTEEVKSAAGKSRVEEGSFPGWGGGRRSSP